MTAEAQLGAGDTIGGKWFQFYDQAFKVDLDNGQRFITNYKYALKEYVASDPLVAGSKKSMASLQTDDYDKFYS